MLFMTIRDKLSVVCANDAKEVVELLKVNDLWCNAYYKIINRSVFSLKFVILYEENKTL